MHHVVRYGAPLLLYTSTAVVVCCVVYLCVVCRFVQFADSGYEADPDIDRIEQQVSLRGITSATRAQPFLYIRPHTS